jgi:hypothetical protein
MPKGRVLSQQEKMALRGLACSKCDIAGGVACASQPSEQPGKTCPEAGDHENLCQEMAGSGPVPTTVGIKAEIINWGPCGAVPATCTSMPDPKIQGNWITIWVADGGAKINSECKKYSRCSWEAAPGCKDEPPPSE